MNRLLRTFTLPLVIAGTLAAAEPSAALARLTREALASAQAGEDAAPGKCEIALALSFDQHQPAKEVQSAYWQIIRNGGDYPRAAFYFAGLARLHPKDAEVLGLAGSALGGYIGWLFAHNLGGEVTPALRSAADDAFAQALALEPDNLTALFGLTLYEAYSPSRRAHARDDLARLEAVAAKHPGADTDGLLAAAREAVGAPAP